MHDTLGSMSSGEKKRSKRDRKRRGEREGKRRKGRRKASITHWNQIMCIESLAVCYLALVIE